VSFGPGPEGTSGRDTTGLGNAWGSRGGSLIRSIFNWVVPVTVVERWYDDITGSYLAITGNTAGFFGHRPSVEFFSNVCDWELHAVNIWYPIRATRTGAEPEQYQITCHMFTAFSGYDPIEFNPTILFGPQLITTELFNQGSVRAQGGTNPANNPLGTGWIVSNNTHRTGMFGSAALAPALNDAGARSYVTAAPIGERPIGWDKKMCNQITFKRPLRMRRNRRLTIQLIGINESFRGTPLTFLTVSALYTELPNPRGAFRT